MQTVPSSKSVFRNADFLVCECGRLSSRLFRFQAGNTGQECPANRQAGMPALLVFVTQTFLSAGAGDFLVACSAPQREHGIGMSREPAGRNACATGANHPSQQAPLVAQTFLSAGAGVFLVACSAPATRTRDRNVPRTRRQECLRYRGK